MRFHRGDLIAHIDSLSTHALLPYIFPNNIWVMTFIIAVVSHTGFRVKNARSDKLLPTMLFKQLVGHL
jgi:hypothetical protein